MYPCKGGRSSQALGIAKCMSRAMAMLCIPYTFWGNGDHKHFKKGMATNSS